MHVSFQIMGPQTDLAICPGVGLLGHMVVLFLDFYKKVSIRNDTGFSYLEDAFVHNSHSMLWLVNCIN